MAWPGTEGTASDEVATSPEVDVAVEDITSPEVEVVAEEEAAAAMEGLEAPGETLVGEEEVSTARARGGTTAATGEVTLREDLVEECPRVRGWTGWARGEVMLLLSEVAAGAKIKVSFSSVIDGYFYHKT